MDDLVQFLRDRLAEDEQVARAAMWDELSDVWTARPPQARYEQYIVADYLDDGVVVVTPENADADGVGRHIARHDPARVLREVEAKRQLLDTFLPDAAGADEQINDEWRAGSTLAVDLLCLLALPYTDHPDYRPEWGP
ncbi:DUF6221 family protein [Streptomyces sp. NPDC058620]|uniref:DUF6221 family protein n=1 Tax=Streptomyces sp. NPDC058620 TaxID=3346560 RepID=UPI00364DB31B